MGDNTTKVIRDITNTPIHVPDGKGEIDMCKAVKDMIDIMYPIKWTRQEKGIA